MMTVLEERFYQSVTHNINRIADSLEHIEKMMAEEKADREHGKDGKEEEKESG